MKIDIEAYQSAADAGDLGHGWRSCMLAVAVGADSIDGCVTKGWPRWLAEYGVYYFDRYQDARDAERGERFLRAVKAVNGSADWDRVCRDWRLDSILPIALEAVGEGDEPWRVECREVVQWSIDNDGAAAYEAAAVRATWVAWAAAAVQAAGAMRAAWSSGAAMADAADRIEESFFAVLEKATLQEKKG